MMAKRAWYAATMDGGIVARGRTKADLLRWLGNRHGDPAPTSRKIHAGFYEYNTPPSGGAVPRVSTYWIGTMDALRTQGWTWEDIDFGNGTASATLPRDGC